MANQEFSTKSTKSIKDTSIVHQRHLVLKEKYVENSTSAWITDSAEVIGKNLHDPFRTSVSINDKMKVPFKIGVHKAVGGDHDFPNPGDLLCASLASCFESTIRLISNKLRIELIETKIYATAQVDVRGTLMIDKSVPIEFQSMHINALIIAKNTNEKLFHKLIEGAKRSCIVYQTIKKGTPITLNADVKTKNNKL
ncbi:OsmC family protein [Flavobacteriaceae bacterium S0825]|uniref:OsmC family protein n=1 Tax=Gaetbulibacter sp. S0825 TaxID=2720084 RepID=UPI001430FE03|nr:OsmC family protein [Gaetbulibacter sp. S0825]MCK0110502.1 OsmC family protein [Flavobacteriaceae bacterium S0825]NIX66131.1 OsmC family protein [Gaetbulibacter sp. S0825]